MRNLRGIVIGLVAVFGMVGCGGDDVVERGCKKDQECNFLQGVSVNECVEMVNQQLDTLTETQRRDVLRVLESCLEFESCSAYDSCINQ